MMMRDEEVLKKLEDITRDANRLQLETLQTILERNSGVRYLQPHLQVQDYKNAPLDVETFRRLVPISCYEDYIDHINRIADGEEDDSSSPVLSVDPLVCFFYSSGTSSMKPKMIPYFDSAHSKTTSNLAHQTNGAVLRRLFPPRSSVNKILWFLYAGKATETKGGFKVMAASAFPFHSNRPTPLPILSVCVSPREVISGSDAQQQMYCHLLCGLRNPNSVDGIRAPYASGLVQAFRLLESKWEQLCNDLECGFLSSEITDVTMRDAVSQFLGGPQPDLAIRIRAICESKDFEGILAKLWPNVRYITCVTTGIMRQYYQTLKYYAGEIPVLGGDYFASECSVAINLDRIQPPELTHFVMLPMAAYFEFLPFDDLGRTNLVAEEAVDFSGVEIGKMYEVVVTTYRGLYRYRLGDVVRVVGFYNSSPKVEYVMRAPKVPSEALTERNLISAMESFGFLLRDEAMGQLIEFTSFMDLESRPEQVTIFVEVNEESVLLQKEKLDESVVLRKCCSLIEDCLGSLYKVRKERKEVGPLVLSIVNSGSFDRLFQVAMKNGTSASQYKPPKIIRNREIVDLLKTSVVVSASADSSNGDNTKE